jgi:hypothetical protein
MRRFWIRFQRSILPRYGIWRGMTHAAIWPQRDANMREVYPVAIPSTANIGFMPPSAIQWPIMQTNKVEVSKKGKGKTIYVPLSIYETPTGQLTISCPDPRYRFKYPTTEAGFRKFKGKLREIFDGEIHGRISN